MQTQSATLRRKDALGVHSLNRFVFSVPELAPAEHFYSAFGLDVRRDRDHLELRTHGSEHCWASVHANGAPKRLQYLSLSAYDDDVDALAARLRARGTCEPHPLSDGRGAWVRDADGTPIQLVVGPKVTPSQKTIPRRRRTRAGRTRRRTEPQDGPAGPAATPVPRPAVHAPTYRARLRSTPRRSDCDCRIDPATSSRSCMARTQVITTCSLSRSPARPVASFELGRRRASTTSALVPSS